MYVQTAISTCRTIAQRAEQCSNTEQRSKCVQAAARAYSPKKPASPASKWQSQSPNTELELPVEKQMKAMHMQEGLQQQKQDKERVLQQYDKAEQQWPYSPTGQGHMRVPLSPSKHVKSASTAAWDIPAVYSGAHHVA